MMPVRWIVSLSDDPKYKTILQRKFRHLHDELQPEFGINIRYEGRIYHASI